MTHLIASLVLAAAVVGADRDLADLTLVRSSEGTAVVKFGNGPLLTVKTGDRVGRHRAEITEIMKGRMVLVETAPGKDGRPHRAQIMFADGQRGGTRYLSRLDEVPPPATKPVVTDPKRKPKPPRE